jgi:hypothetical protein
VPRRLPHPGVPGELGEEPRARFGVRAGLPDDGAHLPGGSHPAVRGGGAQRGEVAVEGSGDIGRPTGDVAPLLGRVRGHEVEDRPDALRRGLDVVQLRQLPAALVDLEGEPEAFPHRVERDLVGRVGCCCGVQFGEGRAGQGGLGLVAGGGVVRVLRLAPGEAEFGGERRVQLEEARGVPVRDRVDGGRLAVGGGRGGLVAVLRHPTSLSRVPRL